MNSNLRNRRSLGRSSQLLRALCTLVHIHRLSNCSAVRRPQKSSLLGRYLLAACCAQLTPRTQIQQPNDRSKRLKQESLACRHNILPFWIISTNSQSCFTEKGLLCFWTMMVNSSSIHQNLFYRDIVLDQTSLGYAGTLTPIVKDPDQAFMSEQVTQC